MLFTQGNSHDYFMIALSCRFRLRLRAVDGRHCVRWATSPSCGEQQERPPAPGEQADAPAPRELQAAAALCRRAGYDPLGTRSSYSLAPCNRSAGVKSEGLFLFGLDFFFSRPLMSCGGKARKLRGSGQGCKHPPNQSWLSGCPFPGGGWAVPGGTGASPLSAEDCRWCWRTREHQWETGEATAEAAETILSILCRQLPSIWAQRKGRAQPGLSPLLPGTSSRPLQDQFRASPLPAAHWGCWKAILCQGYMKMRL